MDSLTKSWGELSGCAPSCVVPAVKLSCSVPRPCGRRKSPLTWPGYELTTEVQHVALLA